MRSQNAAACYAWRMRGTPLVLTALVLCTGCGAAKNALQNGFSGPQRTVASVVEIDGYLDTQLKDSNGTLRTFLPANATCRAVAKPGATVRFDSAGAYGTLQRGDQSCLAAGIGSLGWWRSKRPRPNTASPVPSAMASYRTAYKDESVVFLRGNFPLTVLLGFTAMGDGIAVVPNSALCQRPISQGSSTIEYFPGGRNVLTLSSSDGRCPIQALLRPLTGSDVGA